MIHHILGRQEYLGHIVNFKTYTKSYKNHKIMKNPEEKRMVFKNVNDAIVDEAVWEKAREILQAKRRVPQNREPDPFQSYLYCADCGHKMYIRRKGNKSGPFYLCKGYTSKATDCGTHHITQVALKDLVLQNIQNVVKAAALDKNKFADELRQKLDSEENGNIQKMKKDISKLTVRYNTLDTIIQNLYEDKATGVITTERYIKMSTTYEKEQTEIKEKIAAYKQSIENHQQSQRSVDEFVALVSKYSKIKELSPEILSEFVDKILVHERLTTDNGVEQTVEIVYRGVGIISED